MTKELYKRMLSVLLVAITMLIFYNVVSVIKSANKEVVNLNDSFNNVVPDSVENINKNEAGYNVMANKSAKMVIPSGDPIGIYVKSEGVMITDICDFVDINNCLTAPCKGNLDVGDYIDSINGIQIQDKRDLIEVIKNSNGKDLLFTITRGNNIIQRTVTPIMSKKGDYMLGLWVKDDISGIGTLTFMDEDGFAALGHSINDNDTGNIFATSDGAIYGVNLINIVKAEGTNPGRLEGMIDYSKSNILGRIESNSLCGIKGYMTKNGVTKNERKEWLYTADRNEIKLGRAYIKSSVSGKSEMYEIEITNINYEEHSGYKQIELKIIDERLISLTRGIVQGMSGTPIIQNNKIVGAITHVFVDDSTKGYGIFIDEMLKN